MRHFVLFGVIVLSACAKTPQREATTLRIASQTIDSDAMLWAMDEPTRSAVVAVSSLVDDPRYSPIVNTWPKQVPRVQGTSEALIALSPTVVFLAEWSDPNARAMLEGAHAKVVVLEGYGGFQDYKARVRTVANAVDASERGDQLIGAFDERLRTLSVPEHGASIVSYSSGNAAGTGTTFDDVATAAGFVNLAAKDRLEGHKAVGIEQLVAWQPAYIVVPCEGDCEDTQVQVAAAPGIRDTPAGQQAQVIAIPPALLFDTGERMLDVVEILVQRRSEANGA